MAILSAKLYFIVCGYAVQLLLPRLFESKEVFGRYASVMNLLSVINNVLMVATIQTISKFICEDPGLAQQRLRQGYTVQLAGGAALAMVFYAAAPTIAGSVLLDAQLRPLLRAGAVVILAYSLYACCVGYFNGLQRFGAQAGLDFSFSTVRTSGILLAAFLGYGALGAMIGLAGASLIVLSIGLAAAGIGRSGEPIAWRRWLAFSSPLWLYHVFLNSIMQLDLLVLKRSVAELAMHSGAAATSAAEVASRYVAEYRAAQTFAFVPYQLILAVTFVIFPMMSRAASSGDKQLMRSTIKTSLRLSLLLLLAIAAPIAGAAEGVLRIAYPEAYLPAAGALTVLAFAIAGLALFVIAATALSGSGRPAVAAMVAAVALIIVVVANRSLVFQVGIGSRTLEAAAFGTSVGVLSALVLIGLLLRRTFGPCLPVKSAVRATAAAGFAFVIGRLFESQAIVWALVALATSLTAYVAALWVLREISKTEIIELTKGLRRTKR